MTRTTFRRNPRGNLYARCGKLGLSIFRSKLGGYAWKIRNARGEDRFSEQEFPSEQTAWDDLMSAVVEEQIVEEMLNEPDDYA